MAYTATEEQKKLFAQDHDNLKKILDLGHEILWLAKDECIKAGPDLDETLAIIEKVLMDHGRKEYDAGQDRDPSLERRVLPRHARLCAKQQGLRDQVDRVLPAKS